MHMLDDLKELSGFESEEDLGMDLEGGDGGMHSMHSGAQRGDGDGGKTRRDSELVQGLEAEARGAWVAATKAIVLLVTSSCRHSPALLGDLEQSNGYVLMTHLLCRSTGAWRAVRCGAVRCERWCDSRLPHRPHRLRRPDHSAARRPSPPPPPPPSLSAIQAPMWRYY